MDTDIDPSQLLQELLPIQERPSWDENQSIDQNPLAYPEDEEEDIPDVNLSYS